MKSILKKPSKAGPALAEQSTKKTSWPRSGSWAEGVSSSALTPTRTSEPPIRSRADPLAFGTTPVSSTTGRKSSLLWIFDWKLSIDLDGELFQSIIYHQILANEDKNSVTNEHGFII